MENIADKYLMKKFQDTNKGTNDYEKIEDNQIVELQIDRLVPFKKQQPFSMYDDNKKQEVKESIEKFGVLTPMLVDIDSLKSSLRIIGSPVS